MSVSEVVSAILFWFLAQGGSPWWECGKRYTPQEAQARAEAYAKVIHGAAQRYPVPNGAKVLLAMAMQESALDRCNIAGWKKKQIKGKRNWKPTEKQALEILKKASRKFRVDGGVHQRLYPPHGSWYPPEKALDLRYQVELTAAKLPQYLKICTGNYGERWNRRVTYTWRHNGKVHKKKSPKLYCSDLFFTLHNTGGGRVNGKYYKSVSYHWRLWQKEGGKKAHRAKLSRLMLAGIQ